LRRADRLDADLGVYVSRLDEAALAQAATADRELAAGIDRGPLHGVPMGVKDILATIGAETTAQSLVLDRGWQRDTDAPVVARLRSAGAVITGKLTTMEFAIGMPDASGPFPLPRNPWDPSRWTGGSSSGTAGGVAAGIVFGGVGTDTAGSIRTPASMCGITGLKPTFGRVPKSGCVPLGYTYDHVGPMARSAEDCALMLSVMAGHDESDPCSARRTVDDYLAGIGPDARDTLVGVRIGVDTLAERAPGRIPEVDRLLAAALDVLAGLGADVVPVALPLYDELNDVTMMGFQAEAFAYHRANLRSRWTEFGAATRLHVAEGALFSAGDYVQMQRVRRLGRKRLEAVWESVDYLVTPTLSDVAFLLEGISFADFGDCLHTPYWNATGSPAVSVPMGFSDAGLPLGLQIVGRHFDEAGVLGVAHGYQQETDWHVRVPPIAEDEGRGERTNDLDR
jgi:aspartyl-tRNA(Asn)/glutamyl-tRNA(Gln) amidotransferase subunit A